MTETELVLDENVQDSSDPNLAQMISVSESDHNLIYDMLSEQTQRESVVEAGLPTAPITTMAEPVQDVQLPTPLVESATVLSLVKDSAVQPGPLATQAESESIPAVLEVVSASMNPAAQVDRSSSHTGAESSINQPGPQATQVGTELNLVVSEVESTSAISAALAEGSSSHTVAPSALYDTIRALMADEDPEKAIISAELVGFTFLLHSVIDKVMTKGSSLSSVKRLLDRHVAIIKEEGFPDLADSIAEDLIQLELELVELQKLRSKGASAYISSRMESIMQAREAKRRIAQEELQQAQAQSIRLRASLNARETTHADLIRSVEEYDLEINRLRKALEDAEEARALLKIDLVSSEKSRSILMEQLKVSDGRSIELDQKIIQLLTINDASKALLENELIQKYQEELSSLEERIRQRQLSN